MRYRTALTAALLLGLAPTARPSDRANVYDALLLEQKTTVLAVAVKEAAAVATLKGMGPWTLFAPTDDAFKNLDNDSIARLATDKKAVKALVNAHLVPRQLTAAELRKSAPTEFKTVGGSVLKVEVRDGALFVGGAKVSNPDMLCSNGVIHLTDAVLTGTKK
jgi:uncharacterized surface protein with fasciclin (FAS1) repeats